MGQDSWDFGTTWVGPSRGPHRDPALGWQRAEAIAEMPQMPPCSPAPHNFQAHSAVSAKVDLVSINKGIIARETWLQDGPYPITAVAGLQQPLFPAIIPPLAGVAQPSAFYS